MLGALAAFVAVSAVVICTPGQDTALTIRSTLAGGRRSGIATATGVALGQAVWTLAASAGVVALLSASEPAFRALKFSGAAYLVYLGAQSLVGILFCLMTLAWLSMYAVAVARARRLIAGRARRALDAVTGFVLVALGVRLAAEPK
jgi:threonine/homoserine/homoserine lactone efflux protein